MNAQRHPSERVTPVEVGDPIRWADADCGLRDASAGRADLAGVAGDRRYLVGPLDDVWQAVQVIKVLSHGPGTRDHYRVLRHCATLEAAQRACQDEEHRLAWAALTMTARELLLHLGSLREVAA